ncbi:MAG: kinase/pyrophosphorylase [Hellea sp.]|nr:kinase/pyrophosphorylase [Hellea sp.]MDG1665777.1 kinase/pyrophosphorylase [Hellea sp.]
MSVKNNNISLYFHIHLVSDSTGETLVAIMKASAAQFRNATALEHLHTLVRSEENLQSTLDEISNKPGVVLYTLMDPDRRKTLEKFCSRNKIPAISVLDQSLSMLGRYLGARMISEVAAQRNLDAEYYNRIEALDFAMAHDDGQNVTGLNGADILLLGISRTSKTPTCIYLANRGYLAGNIPLVPGLPLPKILDEITKPFVVGLIASPDRIVQIREQRLVGLNENDQTDYIDVDRVRDEMRQAKRMFTKKGYKVIDVTRKSIEETSAQIIKAYNSYQKIDV